MSSKPRYQHDCDACVFLGEHKKYDLYFCGGDWPTVIARYSSDGPDYTSGIAFKDHVEPIGEAFNRACERGLLKREDYPGMVRCPGCRIILAENQECDICKQLGAMSS